MSYNTKLGQFCADHEDWQQLLSQEPYNLMIKFDGIFVMFNYNQLSSDFNNPIVREARGIIFVVGEWDAPVCHAFDKFGNYGEEYVPDIDWETVTVSEKIDGSIMKLWFWDGKWRVSTSGNISAKDSPIDDVRRDNFEQVFWEGVNKHFPNSERFTTPRLAKWSATFNPRLAGWLATLDPGYTYIFELVSPYNRVVIPYEETDVYFLGARHNVSNNQWGCTEEDAKMLGVEMFPRPKLYPLFTYDEIAQVASELPWNEEGYVCYDENFNRCKIKSPKYVMAHYSRNNNVITRKHLIDIYLKGEVKEFLTYASDYEEQMNELIQLIEGYHLLLNSYNSSIEYARALDRKSYAEQVSKLPKLLQEYIFRCYEKEQSAEEYTSNWDKYRWERVLEQYETYLKKEGKRNDLQAMQPLC